MAKTFLSPCQQSRNTLALAEEWARGARPAIKAVNDLWTAYRSLNPRPPEFINDGYEEIHRRLLAGSRRKPPPFLSRLSFGPLR
jgi:hypothetical protein